MALSLTNLQTTIDRKINEIERAQEQHKRWAMDLTMRNAQDNHDFLAEMEKMQALLQRWKEKRGEQNDPIFANMLLPKLKLLENCHTLIVSGIVRDRRPGETDKAFYFRSRIVWLTTAIEAEYDDRRRWKLTRGLYYARLSQAQLIGGPLPDKPAWLLKKEQEQAAFSRQPPTS